MTHAGDKPKPDICQYCDKCFSQGGHKKQHEMTHTGDKPHKCQYCDKFFSRTSHKKVHEMTHTGDKPHKRQYCDYCFSTTYNEQQHKMKYTNKCSVRWTTRNLKIDKAGANCQYCDKCVGHVGDGQKVCYQNEDFKDFKSSMRDFNVRMGNNTKLSLAVTIFKEKMGWINKIYGKEMPPIKWNIV